MSIRSKILGLVDVMMRVPPILVIDGILKIGMGIPTRFHSSDSNDDVLALTNPNAANNDSAGHRSVDALLNATHTLMNTSFNNAAAYPNATLEQTIGNTSARLRGGVFSGTINLLMDELDQDNNLSNMLALTSVKFVICLIAFLSAASIFMLWTRHLVMVYMFVISLGLTFLSYWSNVSALALVAEKPCMLEDLLSMNTTRLIDTGGVAMSLMPHLVAQWFMGTLFAYIHLGSRHESLQKALPYIFVSPILCCLLPIPPRILQITPALADIIPLMLSNFTLLCSAMDAGKTVYNGYQYAINFISNFGVSALIENEWQRLNVPSVLRVFWTIRITQEFISMVMSDNIANMNFLPTVQKLLVDGCETLTAVLGMTSVISIICHYIGRAFQWYLLTFDSDEEKSLGTVAAVLFYVLALQTGLTSLAPDKRFVRLCRNICLLITALFHFLHNIVSPILMSLSAARNPSRKRHLRALSVCAFLVVVPSLLLTSLWSRQPPSTWLLAVTAFSVEVIVKVLVSLATYTLFLLDARRQTFWEKLDDYLYYVRAFGNSVEFCFGILLFFNGAWILLFESAQNVTGGAIRAIMMCIHAYFNIWCEARAGWSVFMKRRSAVHKISALPEATPAQLTTFDDVCAICYQEMNSAKITRCRHFFHGVCLRKWLYVQDRCPLCHEIMMYTDKDDESNAVIQRSEEEEAPLQLYPVDDANSQGMQLQSADHSITIGVNFSTQTEQSTVDAATSTATISMTFSSTSIATACTSSTTTAAAAAVATAAAGSTIANTFAAAADVAPLE